MNPVNAVSRANLARLTRHRLFWPVAVLVLLLVVNAVVTPGFLAIRVRDGHLYGSLIDILRFGAPLIMVSLGMTMVIATGGIDLSVGSVVAISGAMACYLISEGQGLAVALALSFGLCLVLGLWNGLLVTRLSIQPIIATLILMVGGRGIAQLITGGQIITIDRDSGYREIGGGHLAGLPVAVLIVLASVAAAAVLARRTALGLLLESVGGNAEASRLVGIRASGLIVLGYVFCAVCAGVAGWMISSDVSAADGNNAGLWIELDAILAVVLGGTALTGGRFSIAGTVVGALIIQTLNTTIYTAGIPPRTTLVFEAAVVTFVCLLQSPAFRAKVGRRRPGGPVPPPTDPPSADKKVEVPA
ncbi:ABC transporter permease [Actinomadura livida]|uniref:ABC transporter permease n=1 Tax=Actinomadura livida TaxID=79909 RepID=A0A7W7IGZ2_9ACTN|nr:MULTISPECIES: ABC transporter permease [Actinomadura]MBB4776952.1 simple sugar transport system permease protein [Actinomadura catellatispora]GGT95970.1 sugar ABC transporter permease [Actinomadura livida]